MYNLQLKRKRMFKYFIDAAAQIIKKEGLEKVTIRKVANLAGYNSATLYNYFENLDHLKFLAAMKFTKKYVQNLPRYIKNSKNALDENLLVWECFCYYSYKSPEIYNAIFLTNLNNSILDYITQYYTIYPEELGNTSKNIREMLTRNSLYGRSKILLKECVKQGFFKEEDIDDIIEMTMFIYKGMLSKIINNKTTLSCEELVSKTMKYIVKICQAHLITDIKINLNRDINNNETYIAL